MFLNSVTVEGRLGKDPEMKTTAQGKKIAKVSMAIYQGKEKQPMWVQVAAWEKMADCLMECVKGDSIVVIGDLGQDTWKDKDGADRTAVVINVRGFSHASRPQRQETGPKKTDDGFSEPGW